MSENNFSGNVYFVEATGNRQATMKYLHGKVVPGTLAIIDQYGNKADLKANQKLFAFDDEFEIIALPNNKYALQTVAFQFEVNGAGKLGGKNAPVQYDIAFVAKPDGSLGLKFKITPDSLQDMAHQDMDIDGFPTIINESLTPSHPIMVKTPDGQFGVNPQKLGQMSFPPHHPGGAALMRQKVASQPDLKLPTTWTGETKTKTPAKDFNNPHAPTIVNPVYSDKQIEAIIRDYCKDLSTDADNGKLDPVIGRDEETIQAIKVLGQRKQASLCFTGEAGIGKTAMFTAVAQYISDDKQLPEHLRNARVLELDIQAMLSGSKFRGQFEERLKPLIDGLKEREGYLKGRKVILAIDEIAEQLSAGSGTEGGGSAGGMLKPFLTARGIAVMGTTTLDEYRNKIEKDPALARRFNQLTLTQPKFNETLEILNGLWPNYKEYHGLTDDLSAEDMAYIVHMTDRYAPNESQPNKAEKVLDMAGSSAAFRNSSSINRDDILSAVAKMSKLSKDFLSQNDNDRFLEMQEKLPQEILGQPSLPKIVDGLIGARSGLNDPNQPWGAFILQGPTGTGKTETAKALARYLFGSEDAMVKLDMSEYAEKHSVARLIGAPPGYVGFQDSEPALTEKIRQRPYSILLLDEIEKAHPDVFNVFLSILNDGKMTDNKGKTVLFNNTIILMTSNLGAKEVMELLNTNKNNIGFGGDTITNDPQKQKQVLDQMYADAFAKHFTRPELRNRIEELGGFVTFIPLAPEVIEKLVTREIGKINERLNDKTGAGLSNVTLEISDAVKNQLATEGYKPDMGARPLRKVVREKVSNPLGKWLMANKEKVLAFVAKNGSAKIKIDALDAGFAPTLTKGAKVEAQAAFKNANKKPANDDVIIVGTSKKRKSTNNAPKK